jgi:hypothetical protein
MDAARGPGTAPASRRRTSPNAAQPGHGRVRLGRWPGRSCVGQVDGLGSPYSTARAAASATTSPMESAMPTSSEARMTRRRAM